MSSRRPLGGDRSIIIIIVGFVHSGQLEYTVPTKRTLSTRHDRRGVVATVHSVRIAPVPAPVHRTRALIIFA